jgi:hypothetical protein
VTRLIRTVRQPEKSSAPPRVFHPSSARLTTPHIPTGVMSGGAGALTLRGLFSGSKTGIFTSDSATPQTCSYRGYRALLAPLASDGGVWDPNKQSNTRFGHPASVLGKGGRRQSSIPRREPSRPGRGSNQATHSLHGSPARGVPSSPWLDQRRWSLTDTGYRGSYHLWGSFGSFPAFVVTPSVPDVSVIEFPSPFNRPLGTSIGIQETQSMEQSEKARPICSDSISGRRPLKPIPMTEEERH